jgi:anaerobic selenocysteine-containing dehydrogenase
MTEEVRTFCRICIAHCGLLATVEDDEVVKVRGDADHPASQGYTCAKGRSLPALHRADGRLDRPRLRAPGADRAQVADWTTTMDDLAERVAETLASGGPDSVALFVGNGGSLDPAGRRAGLKLTHALGSSSIYSVATVDAPSKPVVAELVSGNPALFSGSPDFERCTLTILIGTNPLVSHGHTASWTNPNRKLQRLRSQGEVWVVDPRRTETAKRADRHLQPRVDTDAAWLACVLRELLDRGLRPPDDVEYRGLAELRAAVEPWTTAAAARCCGLDEAELRELVDAVARHGRLAVQTGTGVSMTSDAPVVEWLVWALLVLTDSVDQPGGLRFNPGALHRLDLHPWPANRGRVGPGPASRPELPHRLGEHASAGLCDEIEAGRIRVLLVFGGNLLTALPEPGRLGRALATLEALAVVDIVDTQTTALASHVLPSTGQLERADLPYLTDTYAAETWTQATPRVVPPAAERRPGWWIFAELGNRLGIDTRAWTTGKAGDKELADEDFLGPLLAGGPVTLDELKSGAPRVVEPGTGWVRRGVASAGGWDLAPTVLARRLAEVRPPSRDELVLVPRRQLRQQNSQLTRTGTADGRREEPLLLIHPADAEARGIETGRLVEVDGANGALRAVAVLDPDMRRGIVSIPHGHVVNVNVLTSTRTDVDPLTGMVQMAGVPVTARVAASE